MKQTIYLLAALTTLALASCVNDDTDFSEIIGDNSSSSSSGSKADDGWTYTQPFRFTSDASQSKAVAVTYSSDTAYVVVASDIASLLTVTGSGAMVGFVQDSSLSSEITYTLSGSSTKGAFFLDGSSDATVVMSNLTLTSPSRAPIYIADGQRINIQILGTNTLKDSSSSGSKGTLVVKGHSQISGGGVLNLYGYAKHAFWADEYIQLQKTLGTINILHAAADGINVNQHFEQNGGTLTISGVGD